MGMYTGLNFKAIIKKKYLQEIKKLINGEEFTWENFSDNRIKEFGKLNRSSFFPFGYSTMWRNKNKLKGRQWGFTCSLKNYNDEIGAFLKIAKIFSKKIITFDYWYEEEDGPKDYYEIKKYNERKKKINSRKIRRN